MGSVGVAGDQGETGVTDRCAYLLVIRLNSSSALPKSIHLSGRGMSLLIGEPLTIWHVLHAPRRWSSVLQGTST